MMARGKTLKTIVIYVLLSEFAFFCFGGRADHPPGDLKAPNEERDLEVNAIV